ncbi:MAG: hypothetical protein EPN56_02975 [Rhodanobacter sp.]|nr:MAG: hypothetical protein EPN78_11315 [Rhodanobacter sp.]TAM37146.1 MAG: hypothetical protein EPN56_02975 [Rhodanobacter sp.]
MSLVRMALPLALAFGAWGFAGSAVAATPSFAITAPAAGATVSSPVAIVVAVQNAKIGKPTDGLDHLHVSVDGGPAMAVYQPGPVDLSLPAGKHTVEVELAGPTHAALLPPKSVTFTVR